MNQIINNHSQLSLEDNDILLSPVSPAEIWSTVKNIHPYKAPGPNGIQAVFYQTYWNVVGKEVCEFVQKCFHNNHAPEEVNKTFIALIRKVDNPDNIKMFRPISLCNVVYKVITKIIVGRIRPFLHKVVSPTQSSFISGRSTTDNIVITQEVLHTLKAKKGKTGGMIFKIDLEKAYDKVSWKFLFDTQIYFNLNPSWINLIMSCIRALNLPSFGMGKPLRNFVLEGDFVKGIPFPLIYLCYAWKGCLP